MHWRIGCSEADILKVFIDLCYKNECPKRWGGGVQGWFNNKSSKNVVVFKFIVVKNVISSQVTGLFAFDTFLY